MPKRLFQGIIYQMKDSVDRIIGVVDKDSAIVACTELPMIGETRPGVMAEAVHHAGAIRMDGYTYMPVNSHMKLDYVVFVEGEDEQAERYASLISVSLQNIKFFFDEKHDKGTFIKNVLMDNILPGEAYIKAREFKLNSEVNRVVLLVHPTGSTEASAIYILLNLFPDKNKDFVLGISDEDIALVKEVRGDEDMRTLEEMGRAIIDTMCSESFTQVKVGIGSMVSDIRDLARSYKEAQVAIEIGQVFENEKDIVSYDNLGIGRLIYQLPTTMCEMFLSEVFKKGSIDSIDSETLFTIQKFFENSLNVSETSRKLFVHRNTLVYRLDKIKKITGLDIREFDQAIIFKVALMVKKYLDANPMKF